MPTLEEEQLNANLDLLLQIQLDNVANDPVATQNLKDKIEKVREEYREAAEKGKSSKYHKDLADSIAKSVPLIVKGVYAATAAFKKGDYITGSAAIMDICASVIPVFTSLFSAAGPAGALVGALFSLIGQILSFFAPQQPSLEEKIQKMLDHLKSEDQIQDMTAVGYSISSYTTSLRTKCMGIHKMEKPVALAGTVSLTSDSKTVTGTGTTFTQTAEVGQWLLFDSDTSQKLYKIDAIANDTSLTLALPYVGTSMASSPVKQVRRSVTRRSIEEILAMPLTTEPEADVFLVELEGLQWGLVRDQGKLDAPVFATWKVAAYLEREENRSKEGWPEVLGVWCRTYTDLLTANMMLSCLADPKTVDRLLDETRETNKQSPLPAGTRKSCHDALIKLKALVIQLPRSWESDKKQMLKIVEKVRPAARERGMYAHLGYWSGGNVLYIANGNGSKDALKWDYKKNTAWLTSISIRIPKEQIDSFVPKYELLACEDGNRIGRHSLDSVTGTLSDGTPLIVLGRGDKLLGAHGIAMNGGMSGVDNAAQLKTLITLAIAQYGDSAVMDIYTVDKDDKATRQNASRYNLRGTRCVTRCLYPAALPDDPDADALSASKEPVIYATHSQYVMQVQAFRQSAVIGPEPWVDWYNCNGIEVDPYYLWVFGKSGIRCATHASIMKCRQEKIEHPTWFTHDFDKQFTNPEVMSLYPCADGTLVISMLDDIYTADYEIDRKSNRIVTSSWVKRGGKAKQVIKMPIACWPVLESLKANLQLD